MNVSLPSFARKALLAAGLAGALSLASTASAQITINVIEDFGAVYATGSGSANITALTQGSTFASQSGYDATLPAFRVGFGGAVNVDSYTTVSGPSAFGTGSLIQWDVSIGDQFGFNGTSLIVPAGYVSGTALSGTSDIYGLTLAQLGLTEGTYVYSWGGASAAETLTLNISTTSAVPEPSSFAALAGFAMLGLAGTRRRRTAKASV